ncbi:CO/xanthine dehydrogenase Mo-binding subunit [Bradyrhizobium sp. LM3.6]
MITDKSLPRLSRRAALTGGLATGFLLAFHLPLRAAVNEPVQPVDTTDGKFAPNAFIRIDEAGRTILIMPQVEMGQGTYTSISAVLAEELDADWSKVEVQHAPPNDKLYGNPAFGLQATGNSNSIRAWWTPLRKAGATARAMLVQAAASQWGVEPASCSAAKGEVAHAASGRKLGYGAVALAAQGQTPPKDVAVKDPKDFVIIGQPLKRLDTPDKVNGKAVYGIDAILPGMKFATVAACPVFGGKVGKVDDSAAVKLPGVRKVVVLDDMVAVIGDHMWAAKKGLEALQIEWNEGPNAKNHDQGHLGGSAQGQREGRCGREVRRRYRQSARERRQVRGGLRVAVPGARLDGADQRHRPRQAGLLRDMDRHADHDARAVRSGEGRGPSH